MDQIPFVTWMTAMVNMVGLKAIGIRSGALPMFSPTDSPRAMLAPQQITRGEEEEENMAHA